MMGDTVRSKPWLGLLGNISACMSTAAAFGLAMYLGVEFIGINLAAPFLMIGEFDAYLIARVMFSKASESKQTQKPAKCCSFPSLVSRLCAAYACTSIFPIFHAFNELSALCKLVCHFEDDLRALTEKTFS